MAGLSFPFSFCYSHHYALPVTPPIGSEQSLQQWSRWWSIASRASRPSFGLWTQLAFAYVDSGPHPWDRLYSTTVRSTFCPAPEHCAFLLTATEIHVCKLFHLFVESASGVLLIWADFRKEAAMDVLASKAASCSLWKAPSSAPLSLHTYSRRALYVSASHRKA